MSNVYRYKNCIRLNIWNSTRPEIDGHCRCIFNVETQEFRLFKFGTWGSLTWITKTPIVEITEYSEETRISVIKAVKEKIEEVKAGLPEGVEFVTVYDRAPLIEGAVKYLEHKSGQTGTATYIQKPLVSQCLDHDCHCE